MNQRYRDVLDYEIGARILVELTTDRRSIVDYAVILTVDDQGSEATVRVYDGARRQRHAPARSARRERHPRRRSMPVPLGKGCEPRSSRFAPTTRR
jgi:hypothetical protein